MEIRNKQNFGAGVFFAAFGGFAAVVARGYTLGTAEDIGPGYFPFWLSVLLGVLGAVLAVSSLAPRAQRTEVGRLDWKSMLWIVGAVLLFAVLLAPLGVILAMVALVLVAARGSHEFTWTGAVGSALVLGVLVYLVFVQGLHLQFPTWPTIFA
ncbi:tripartite tricarboxylate transporter TctB family protein [Propionivibrio sp.]|uniref:tripartite tricarboxylate transporter TctB family protein n=1 Tax=Propionivibrio sp. TaxID=2212460 RepID=UPI0039E70971